jgi:CubicO group peptidase (beta-lactamase class C family)
VRDLLTFVLGIGAIMAPPGQYPIQRAMQEAAIFFRGNSGWGLGFQVFLRRTTLASTPRRFGWTGGTGTFVYTDPAEELIGILLTQREMTSPLPPNVFRDFWTSAYQAIDD